MSKVWFASYRDCHCTFLGTREEVPLRCPHGNRQIAAEYRLLIEFIRLRLGCVQEKEEAARL